MKYIEWIFDLHLYLVMMMMSPLAVIKWPYQIEVVFYRVILFPYWIYLALDYRNYLKDLKRRGIIK